jgi:hypothetical protein
MKTIASYTWFKLIKSEARVLQVPVSFYKGQRVQEIPQHQYRYWFSARKMCVFLFDLSDGESSSKWILVAHDQHLAHLNDRL